ncbi:MAG: Diacylglycerol kinase [Friedmanniella sp.]|nr:Diacylglycerol kinase [Friedmanniella sp.]
MTGGITLVVNPSAGKGRARARLPEVARALRSGGRPVTVQLSRDFAEARTLVTAAVESGVDVLAVMGGDGMMHLGLNACARGAEAGGPTVLGLVPAGTGNDLCGALGIDPADPEAAARLVARGAPDRIDLAEVHDSYVGAVLATGFDALVNRRANALPWPRGSLRYVVAALAEIRVFRPLSYRLTLDGEVRELEAMLVAVGNTSRYGGGMQICPDADPRDGWLDLTVIHPVSRPKLLQLLPQMNSGRFVRDACVERLRAREVVVEGPGLVGYGDGELVGAAPMTVSCRPGVLPVFCPAP